MIDKSLAQELEGAAKKSKLGRRLLMTLALGIVIIVSTLTYTLLKPRSATDIGKAILINPVEDRQPSGEKEASPNPTPADRGQAAQIAPNVTPPIASPQTDMAVIDATMCRKMTEEAIAASIEEVQWYYKQKQDYNKLYYGRWDSPEALDAFANTRAYTEKWYSDYISRSDPAYKQFCHTGGSLLPLMHQPDYTIEAALGAQ